MSAADTPRMRPAQARVCIGLPVYNGERYLETALRSLLSQSFADFELIISDNASTDRTNEICLDYVGKDPRIRYNRNASNIGLLRNHNLVIEKATGEYFMLAHYDDVRDSSYLARTVDVLDHDPSAVICHSLTADIDDEGNRLQAKEPSLRLASHDLRARFHDIIRMDHMCNAIFGLTRLSALRNTRLHGYYADSDRVLLAELVLRGRCHEVQEFLFFRRWHATQSTELAPGRQARTHWLIAGTDGQLVFPYFRQFEEYLAAILRAPVSWRDKLWCLGEMARWTNTNRNRLLSDIEFAGREILRPLVHRISKRAL